MAPLYGLLDLGGLALGRLQVLQPILEADRLINVPIVKHHSLSGATLGMKNWYGLLGGRRNIFHQDIQTIIAELAFMVKPTLVVLDATTTMISVFGGLSGGIAVLIWWLFFSRVPLRCRWMAFFLMVLSTYAVTRLADPSITTSYQGMMIFNYILPFLSLALVLWATFSQKLSLLARRLTLIASILVACGIWTLFRSEGITGSGSKSPVARFPRTQP